MIKKREEKRVSFRKMVICKCGDEMHPAFIQDISQHGIGIQTMQIPVLNRKMRIALAVESESIFIDGEVRWIHEYTGSLAAKPREVGIHVSKPPAAYLRLLAESCDRTQCRPACEPLK